MSREDFQKFTRALVATLLAALVLWMCARLGVQIHVPTP